MNESSANSSDSKAHAPKTYTTRSTRSSSVPSLGVRAGGLREETLFERHDRLLMRDHHPSFNRYKMRK